MSLPLNSIWKIKIDTNGSITKSTDEIKIIESKESDFIGKYINKNDNSIFYGEVRTNERTIINIKQYQRELNYYAFYIGIEEFTGLIRYNGRWINVNGDMGNFEFYKI